MGIRLSVEDERWTDLLQPCTAFIGLCRRLTTKEQIFQEAFNLPLIIPLTLDLRDSELEQDRDDSVLAFVSFLSSMICDSTNPNVDGVSPDRFGDWLHNDTPSLQLPLCLDSQTSEDP